MKISVGASSFGATDNEAIELLHSHGIEVVKNPYGRKLTKEETVKHIEDSDGLLAGLEILDEEVLSKALKLKAIARIGIGTDNVDFDACSRHNIKVSNTPDAPTEAVAEMAVAALLTIAHQIVPCNKDVHDGNWKKRIGFSLFGINVLIIGYGRIGRRFADHLRYFGSNVLIYDPFQPELSEKDLSIALQKADVVSLHASGKEEILGEYEFKHLKDGAVILNCARGSLINEDMLYNNLNSGKVAFYWGDVFSDEPYSGKLCERENAILTPHISTYNTRCRKEMELQAVHNILRDLNVEG